MLTLTLIVKIILAIVGLIQFMIKLVTEVLLKKNTNMLDNEKHKDFARIETMREEIEQTFSEKLLTLDPNDLTFEARKYWVNIERAENLDALQKNQKHIFFNIDQIMENSLKSKATKALIDFDYLDSVLIQSVTIKK